MWQGELVLGGKKRVPFSGEKGIGNWGRGEEWDIESDWEEREGL